MVSESLYRLRMEKLLFTNGYLTVNLRLLTEIWEILSWCRMAMI